MTNMRKESFLAQHGETGLSDLSILIISKTLFRPFFSLEIFADIKQALSAVGPLCTGV